MSKSIISSLLLIFMAASFFPGAYAGLDKSLDKWNIISVKNRTLSSNNGTVVYSLNSALFSDYAIKFRTITVPMGDQAVWNGRGYDFPIGTVLSKTFYYPVNKNGEVYIKNRALRLQHQTHIHLDESRMIETRLLVLSSTGWTPYIYLWDNTGARPSQLGESLSIKILSSDNTVQAFTYQVPGVNECQQCHVKDTGKNHMEPLGFSPVFLDKVIAYTSGSNVAVSVIQKNQLNILMDKKVISVHKVPEKKRFSDNETSEARKYLAINCAHCHNPKGGAKNINISLEFYESALYNLGVCKSPTAFSARRSIANVIWPRDTDRSMLIYRMKSKSPAVRMPEIGRTLVDWEGLALVSRWISRMDVSCR